MSTPLPVSFQELLFGLLPVEGNIWRQHLEIEISRKKISEFLGTGISAILLNPCLYTPVRAICLAQVALNIKATKERIIQTSATIAIGSSLTVLERCPTAIAHGGLKSISLDSDALIDKYDELRQLPLELTAQLDQAALVVTAQMEIHQRKHLRTLPAIKEIITIVKNTPPNGEIVV